MDDPGNYLCTIKMSNDDTIRRHSGFSISPDRVSVKPYICAIVPIVYLIANPEYARGNMCRVSFDDVQRKQLSPILDFKMEMSNFIRYHQKALTVAFVRDKLDKVMYLVHHFCLGYP